MTSDRIYCAGGCGNEGPFEHGSDTCSGCIAELQARERLAQAHRRVAEAAERLAEAQRLVEDVPETEDMIGRLRHECKVALGYMTPVDPHELGLMDTLRPAGAEGLPIVALATRSGLSVDVLSSALRSLVDSERVEEFTHDSFQGEPVAPTTRYRLRR